MYKILASLLFVFLTFTFAAEDTYIFKAKGEFAKELKTLMDKYAKEGKVEIQEVDETYTRPSQSVNMVDAFLNNEGIIADISYGKKLYESTCFKCHGEKADKVFYSNARVLSTLSKKELIDQLESYSTDELHGGSTRVVMYQAVVGMSTEDIVSVAGYIYSIKNGTDLSNLNVETKQEEESNEAPSSYLQ